MSNFDFVAGRSLMIWNSTRSTRADRTRDRQNSASSPRRAYPTAQLLGSLAGSWLACQARRLGAARGLAPAGLTQLHCLSKPLLVAADLH